MKHITSIVLLFFALTISAQQTTFEKFYKNHKDKSAFSMNLNASFAGSFLGEKDKEELNGLLENAGDFKLMVFENEDAEVAKDFKRFVRKYKLTTMARVKDNGNNAEFYIVEKNNRIKEIILRANSDKDKLVLFGLETDMTKQELADLMSDSNIKFTRD